MELGPLVALRRDGPVASLFDMTFTLPPVVEMTEVVKDMAGSVNSSVWVCGDC